MNDSNRHTRHKGRAALRNITGILRCFDCGRQTHTEEGAVGIRRTGAGVVGFSGVTSCGRVWVCPVCNAKIMAQRAADIRAVLVWAAFKGLHVIFGSLTVRHNANMGLEYLLELQKTAWRSVVQSRHWSANSATLTVDHIHDGCANDCERKRDTIDGGGDGRVGYIRAAEITIGQNGWHPHFHPIIFYRGTKQDAEQFARRVVKTWVASVVAAGGDAIEDGGQQLRVYSGAEVSDALGDYVTKATYDPEKLSLEAVWSQGKSSPGRRAAKTASHWAILAGVAAGLVDDVNLWLELEDATAGHRMITWSRGLRDFAQLGEELDDETIAAEEVGDVNDTVAVLPNASWRILRDTPAATAGILDELEISEGAMAVELDSWGVEWWWLEDIPIGAQQKL